LTTRQFLYAFALVGALISPALAADLYTKAPAPPPPPPPPDWSGVYVGLEGGYGWGHQSIDPAIDPFFFGDHGAGTETDEGGFTDPTIGSENQHGWLFGGFAGAQKQWGNWVLGIEADFDGADIKGSATSSTSMLFPNIVPFTIAKSLTLNSKIDELGSVRGKVGIAAWQNWLFYGTGGLAFAHVKNTVSAPEIFTAPAISVTSTTPANFSGGASMLGWAAGAGVDWKWPVDAGSSWVFGLEYLHYGFPTNTLTLADDTFGLGGIPGTNISFNTKQSVDTIKGRISYLFSIH